MLCTPVGIDTSRQPQRKIDESNSPQDELKVGYCRVALTGKPEKFEGFSAGLKPNLLR